MVPFTCYSFTPTFFSSTATFSFTFSFSTSTFIFIALSDVIAQAIMPRATTANRPRAISPSRLKYESNPLIIALFPPLLFCLGKGLSGKWWVWWWQ
ncbi:hypothetical protein BGX38DRAFT_1188130 [Terfezia claveryi]|nr:hypothetical protein BGX38DRAFT_1188130 [Terfezia claveryi]